jgi:hypothetical protein
MIESVLYGTWIGGQVFYWFFLKHSDASSWDPVSGGFTTQAWQKTCGGGFMQVLAISGSLRAAPC